MAVGNTAEDVGATTQGRKDVSSLVTSLETLQIKESSPNAVPELEESFSQINLGKRDSLHLQENEDAENAAHPSFPKKEEEEEKEDETAEEDDVLFEVKETALVKKEKEDAEDLEDEKASAGDEEQDEKESNKENQNEKLLDKADIYSEKKEESVRPKDDTKEDMTHSTVVNEEDATSKSEDEESSDENYQEVVVLSRKEASNKRGPCVRGPGVQSMPSCMMYTGQPIGLDNYDVSANNYNFPPVQQQMCSPGYVTYKSPLYASSPGYQDNCLPDQTDTGYIMDSPLYQPNMSPASSALETYLPSPMLSGSYYQNEISGASPGHGMTCYEFPDTPNSLRDDSEAVQMPPSATRQASDYGQVLENQSFVSEPRKEMDIGSILEAIYRVENKPRSSPIPVEDLVEITKNLRSCEVAGIPNFSNSEDDLEKMLEVAPCLQNIEDIIRYYQHVFASSSAEKDIKEHLDQNKLRDARIKAATITNENLVLKDIEGDTPPMIIACDDIKSPSYYENLVAVIERQKYINICCDVPVNKVHRRCSSCLSNDLTSFYSSLAMKNNKGDTLLTCVIKLKYPEKVVMYICENLMARSADILRVFNSESVTSFYVRYTGEYPVLKQMLHLAQALRCNPHFKHWTCSQ
ncbi:uncharacterized protein LOC125046789 [Penaeus chinensis]|uniref:uncharacterized protein LOC125046789 n=1 Tax=Penaeus chinensis TaxID=139456 RepID=UPI001FB679BD|nr:uncharacterized protein LOC125046789 [Penaeus chinensis]